MSTMIKLVVRLLLIVSSIVVVGCYSATQFTLDDFPKTHPSEDESLIMCLDDDASLQVFSYHHVTVVDSTEFFFGVGTERKSGLGFKGKIPIEQVDSIRTGFAGPDSTRYLVCWVKNGTSIVFSEEDYLWIKPNSERGFWCTGTLKRDGEQSLFKGLLRKGQIVELKTEKFDVLKTALLTSPALLLFVIPKDWKPFKWAKIKL